MRPRNGRGTSIEVRLSILPDSLSMEKEPTYSITFYIIYLPPTVLLTIV